MKLGFIGVENSHAPAFLRLIRENPEIYGDITVAGVYSYDGSAAEKLVADGLAQAVHDGLGGAHAEVGDDEALFQIVVEVVVQLAGGEDAADGAGSLAPPLLEFFKKSHVSESFLDGLAVEKAKPKAPLKGELSAAG